MTSRKSFLALGLLIATFAFSQTTTFPVRGRIVDSETQLPIPNVGVSLGGTLKGTLSDSAGLFRIEAPESQALLKFRVLGYRSKSVKLSKVTDELLTVVLEQEATQLKDVEIQASRIKTISKSKRFNVLDYDFYDRHVLMITYVNLNKARLVLLGDNSDTLAFMKIPGEPNRLFRDCLGNLHVVCKDSIYQAYYNGRNLSLLPGKSIGDFEKILLPCVAQDSAGLYLVEKYQGGMVDAGIGELFRANALAMSYIRVDKKKRQRLRFITLADEHKMTMSMDEVAFEARKEAAGLHTFGDRLFAEKLLFTEIYAPLFCIDQRICIFDYVNGNIKWFDSSAKLKTEVPITYHKSLTFQEEMQIDPTNWRTYALFESGGISELKEIDLQSGGVKTSYQIPFAFATHIKVYGDQAYFICKEKGDENATLYLARMNLDQ